MDTSVTKLISSKAHLFYYSFRQVRDKYSGITEVNAANKITIRKNDDYLSNGLEFLVYNCALSPKPELCGGIRYTSIVKDTVNRVDFYGKGYSGNGFPLNDRMGVFTYEYGFPELVVGKTNERNIYSYYNVYGKYGKDTFLITHESIREFIASTDEWVDGQAYNPFSNSWQAIRAFVLDYYSRVYGMSRSDFPGTSQIEWMNKEKTTEIIDPLALLKQLEGACDERVHAAYRDYLRGNEYICWQKLENMVSLVGTYYILYRTLL